MSRGQLLKDVDNLASWTIENGGDGWALENDETRTFQKCFASSFGWCRKSQLIDLLALGFEAEKLDQQPLVKVTDYCRSRGDCDGQYELKVELLDASKNPLPNPQLSTFNFELDTAPTKWYQVNHTFQSYGPGLRYISFEQSGKDKKFWKGHYGAQVAGSSVTVDSETAVMSRGQLLKDVDNPASWTMQNGGDGWNLENDETGTFQKCFASSFEWCRKSQLIDLLALGFEAEKLDQQPLVKVTDYCRSRGDCDGQYELKVELLDAGKNPLPNPQLSTYNFELDTAPTKWYQVKHTFQLYGPGLRYISFEQSGKDKKFWKGHYGAQVAGSSVLLYF